MRRWLLPLVTAMILGLALAPAQPAGAALDKTGFWIGSCVGEMDVVVSNKPSFTSLIPDFTASINDSGLTCAIASTDYNGTTGELLSVNLGNVTPVTCEAGLLDGGSGSFTITQQNSFFPNPFGVTTALEFNATAATLLMVKPPNFNAVAELAPLDPVGLTNACATPPGGSMTIRYEAAMVFEDPVVDPTNPTG